MPHQSSLYSKTPKYGSIKFIAVDFDNTIVNSAPFPQIGTLKPKVRETLRELKRHGVSIIIWTCRTGNHKSKMTAFLKEHGVPFDWVNENPHCREAYEKVFADIYLDDRGVAFKGDWGKVLKDIKLLDSKTKDRTDFYYVPTELVFEISDYLEKLKDITKAINNNS